MKLDPAFILKRFPELQQKKVYLAISGGLDSVVLLNILLSLKIEPHLLHCNFNLRGEESNTDETFVKELALKNCLALECKHFDTERESLESKKNIQETARNLRYDWFKTVVESKAILLSAHHLSDDIETFFINILRGTGIKGLAAIPEKRDNILRPLLNYSKETLHLYAQENSLYWREDSSNKSDKYLRNKIRNHLIPLLKDFDESVETKFATTLKEVSEVNKFIETKSLDWKLLNINNQSIKLVKLKKETAFFIGMILKEFGVHRSNLNSFQHFLSGESGGMFFTNSHEFTKTHTTLFFRPIKESGKESWEINTLPFKATFGNNQLTLLQSDDTEINPSQQQMDANKVKFPLQLRGYKSGDRITPLGLKGSKLISKIFIEHKMSAFEKEEQFVLEDADKQILAVIGICIAESTRITETTTSTIHIDSVKQTST